MPGGSEVDMYDVSSISELRDLLMSPRHSSSDLYPIFYTGNGFG